MPKLVFDKSTERGYENGVDNGIVYIGSGWTGYAWNGLTSVDVAPDGGETEALWADNMKYAVMRGSISYAATINAYSYPEEFNECLGNIKVLDGVYIHEQTGTNFRMHYRTTINNAENGLIGWRHHVVYGLSCDPSDMTFESINDSPEAVEFSFEVEGSPIALTLKDGTVYNACEFSFDEYKDSTRYTGEWTKAKVDAILDKLYGSANGEASCPDPDTLFAVS